MTESVLYLCLLLCLIMFMRVFVTLYICMIVRVYMCKCLPLHVSPSVTSVPESHSSSLTKHEVYECREVKRAIRTFQSFAYQTTQTHYCSTLHVRQPVFVIEHITIKPSEHIFFFFYKGDLIISDCISAARNTYGHISLLCK